MMKRLPIILLAISVSALAVMFTSFTPPSASAAGCGPGSHWIDTCPAGSDDLGTTGAEVGIDFVGPGGEGPPDCVEDVSLILSGDGFVDREAGQSATTPHSIDTEITSMSLTDGTATLRVGAGGSPALSASDGVIEEQSGDDTLGDSSFDVFFEIDDGTNPKMYNQSALTVTAVIDRVPPQAIYLHPESICIDLYTAPSGGVDTFVNLVEAQHNVGGIAEVLAGGSHSPASASAGSGLSALTYAGLAGAVGAGMLAVAAGGWYARRRFR